MRRAVRVDERHRRLGGARRSDDRWLIDHGRHGWLVHQRRQRRRGERGRCRRKRGDERCLDGRVGRLRRFDRYGRLAALLAAARLRPLRRSSHALRVRPGDAHVRSLRVRRLRRKRQPVRNAGSVRSRLRRAPRPRVRRRTTRRRLPLHSARAVRWRLLERAVRAGRGLCSFQRRLLRGRDRGELRLPLRHRRGGMRCLEPTAASSRGTLCDALRRSPSLAASDWAVRNC
jgi:hypothetical protein